MKISRWPSNIKNFFGQTTIIEVLVIIAIIAILTAMLLPALAKAKQRADQIEAQKHATVIQVEQSFQVGDSVKVEGLDRKGIINYIHGSDGVDILMKSADGSPTIIKGVNPKLLSK